MKILIHSLNYFPELTGIGKYTGEMADWFAKKGHKVKVITAPPYYPEWRIDSNYPKYQYVRELSSQITVIRCPLWVPIKPNGIKRLLHLASFAISSFPAVLLQAFWKPTVVILIEPPLLCALQTIITAKLTKSTAILHIQDFELDAAFELGILKNKRLRKLATIAESFIMNQFDIVSTISGAMAERIEKKGVQKQNIELFPNWVDTSIIFPKNDLGAKIKFKSTLSIPEHMAVALYSGNLGEKQGLNILIEAARKLASEKDLLFLICGDGAAKISLQEQAKGLENVKFIPLQPLNKLNDLLNLADIHLIPQRSDAEDLVMPSKLTGIFACGGPVVATANPESELGKAVLSAGGLISPPGNIDKLVSNILQLKNNESARNTIQIQARNYAMQNLHIDKILSRFESTITNI